MIADWFLHRLLAVTIAVGGTIKYAMHGNVDIRLAMMILGGSLFGIQLGAIGTTYVKPFMVKVVMGTIMGWYWCLAGS